MATELQYQFCDNSSILIINSKGLIRRLYTPFKVQCILPIEKIREGIWVYVEEIRSTPKDEIIYLIHGKEYRHFHFCITVGF